MRLSLCAVLFMIVPAAAGCASLRSVLPATAPDPDRLAADVTIARDEWGVPHVFGGTDASVAFGLGYAQAEDDLWQLEEEYLHSLGRASHWYGERYLASDLVRAAFEVERLAREEYAREPPARRQIWDAFTAGINHFITASGARPRLITHYEPWMPFALVRSIDEVVDGIASGDGLARIMSGAANADSAPPASGSPGASSGAASGAWAVAPRHSASRHALLHHRDGGSFTGRGRPYEMMLHSEEGWHVRGMTRLGLPVPVAGRNAHIAWAYTPTDADVADVFRVTPAEPGNPSMYRFDGTSRSAATWSDTLLVNSPAGVRSHVIGFRRTHHGPIVADGGGAWLAMRVARMEEGGSLQQLYETSRAGTLDEFRAALDQRAFAANVTYADGDGSIYHLHGGAVPVRDTSFDWTAPVDGSTSASDWRGFHTLDQLPEIHNPSSGWIRAGDPYTAAGEGSPDRTQFPEYVSRGSETMRERAERSALTDSVRTFEQWAEAAFDAGVRTAAGEMAALIMEWEQIGGNNPLRARVLDEAVDRLRAWDRRAVAGSEAAALFVLWQERLRTTTYDGEYPRFRAMEYVLAELGRSDSAAVTLGAVNRLQRRLRGASFEEDGASMPAGGAPDWAGSIFVFDAVAGPAGDQVRYGVGGTRWIGVFEMGTDGRIASVVPFGQSGDPASPHWFDQAALYTAAVLKPGALDRDEVMAAATRVYRPGDR